MNNIIVNIASVGTGDDTAYGMASGSLAWSSATGLKTGIIDERSISGIGMAIDITKGGNLGGFIGDVSVIAVSSELIAAVVSGTIELIGKTMTIGVAFDGTTTPIQRFIGKVGSWTAVDEITLEIVCQSENSLDTKVIPSVTITQEMALNVDGSNAIGKSVTTTYGNICDFPMIQVDSDKLFMAILLEDDLGTTIDCLANKNTGGDAQLTAQNEYKGKSLCSLHGIYQSAEDSYIWVALSFNGKVLFGSGAESNLALIRSALVGNKLSCVHGNGSGESLKILAVAWDTHDLGSVNLETIWIQVNSTSLSSFTMMGGFDDSGSNVVGKYLRMSGGSRALAFKDTDLVAPYNDSELVNGISLFQIVSGKTCFIIDKSASLDDCKIIGVSDSGKISDLEIPFESISIIYETDKWKMILVSMSSLVRDSGASFEYTIMRPIETRIYDPDYSISPYYPDSLNLDWIEYSTTEYLGQGAVLVNNFVIPEAGQEVSYSSSSPNGGAYTDGLGNICLYVPIEGLINNDDISNSSSCFIIPDYTINIDTNKGTIGSSGSFISAEISVYTISEGNQVIGSNTYFEQYSYDDIADMGYVTMSVSPTNGAVYFDNKNRSYSTTAYGLYDKIKSILDLSNKINIDTAKKIRCFVVKIYFHAIMLHYPSDTSGRGMEITKNIRPCQLGYSKNISKDKLFLRSARVGNIYNTIYPAGLALSIAGENGIPLNTDSFGEVIITQSSLFDQSSLEFDGQFQPDNNTSVADCLSEIAKTSMMAMFQKQSGDLYCKWFADDDQNTASVFTFDGSNVIKGSMQISKPQGGYLYTDFVFGIKRGANKPVESLYINTDPDNQTFPSAGAFSVSGTQYNSSNTWSFEMIRDISATELSISCRVRTTTQSIDPMTIFIEGTKWQIGATGGSSQYYIGTITAISLDYLCPADERGLCVAFTLDSVVNTALTITTLQLYVPVADWRDYVSGTFVSDHTTAKNIWDHAEQARVKLGKESVMPSDTTTLKNPVWGSDSRALTQWILYSTIYATRDKTIIRFTCAMTELTAGIALMDYVSFAWGIYEATPTKGWVVEISDNLDAQTIDFTILTSISDSDVLILNENYASADLILDERTTQDDIYNEGALA